jgi:hypothetical protein
LVDLRHGGIAKAGRPSAANKAAPGSPCSHWMASYSLLNELVTAARVVVQYLVIEIAPNQL